MNVKKKVKHLIFVFLSSTFHLLQRFSNIVIGHLSKRRVKGSSEVPQRGWSDTEPWAATTHATQQKELKHSDCIMIWLCFRGDNGRSGLYFILSNVATIKGANANDDLSEQLLNFYQIHGCTFLLFMYDGFSPHTSRVVYSLIN